MFNQFHVCCVSFSTTINIVLEKATLSGDSMDLLLNEVLRTHPAFNTKAACKFAEG
jgi:hypothetical protein